MHAGVEAVGKKFVCAVGVGPDDIVAEATFPTTTPEETLGRVTHWIAEQHRTHRLDAVGVACFGPVDLRPDSPSYGHITTTPKEGWADTDVVGRISRELDLPVRRHPGRVPRELSFPRRLSRGACRRPRDRRTLRP